MRQASWRVRRWPDAVSVALLCFMSAWCGGSTGLANNSNSGARDQPPQSGDSTGGNSATRNPCVNIRNFYKIDADLYRGARPKFREEVYLKLAALGIRTIVNLEGSAQAAKEQALVARTNKRLLREGQPQLEFDSFPIEPLTGVGLMGVSDRRMQVLFAQLQKAPKPVFIHCKHGRDRTGAIVAIYRMRRGELSYSQAYEEALHYKFDKWLDMGLRRTIRRYRNPEELNSLPMPVAPVSRPEANGVGGSPGQR